MKILTKLFILINTVIVLGLLVTGYMSGLSPEKWGWISLIGYIFPFFIVATLVCMVMWLFIKPCLLYEVKKRYMLISFVGLIVSYYPITLYCPLNFFEDDEVYSSNHVEPGNIKLLSFNTCSWGLGYKDNEFINDRDITDEEKFHIMIDYIKSVNADIVSVQEGNLNGPMDTLKNIYHYTDTISVLTENGNNSVLMMSKYPIVKKENLNLISKGNCAGAFWLNVRGHEIIVVNVHLESMGFSISEREKFSYMVHGMDENSDSVKRTSKTIFGKILASSKIRAKQAEQIAGFVKNHIGTPIIVMGDFNDIPQSYTHEVISDDLQDCYRAKGFGPGYTFKHFGMRARIDNILCSNDFTPVCCKVDDNIRISDHQPVIAVVKLGK